MALRTNVVHCQKEPYDVYIGCRMPNYGLLESPFANRSDGDYETYLCARLISDRGLAKLVMDLHGKRLGCWCKNRSGRDFAKCHGHILARWADKIFAKWQQLNPDRVAMRDWLNAEAGWHLGNPQDFSDLLRSS